MIGALYELSLAGVPDVEVEDEDGRRTPLRAERWVGLLPGDASLLDRCAGHTLDIGSGPGRLTVALARRGRPVLGIDVTPHAVELSRRAGGLALCRDIFSHVPGTGRWRTVLLADGNIGIGGDPLALLRRAAVLLRTDGRALVEVDPPGRPTARRRVRLRGGGRPGPFFTWAYVGADGVGEIASEAGLIVTERWTESDRWFVTLARAQAGSSGR